MTDVPPSFPPETPTVPPPSRSLRLPPWLPWLIVATLAIACAGLGQLYLTTRAQDALMIDQETLADFERRTVQNQLEAERIISRQEIAALRRAATTAIEPILLAPPQQSPATIFAAIVWNPAVQQGVLRVTQLPLPPAGHRYRLWLVDAHNPSPIDAGLIARDPAAGRAPLTFRPSQPVGATPRFVIRVENAGASPAASAPVVLQSLREGD